LFLTTKRKRVTDKRMETVEPALKLPHSRIAGEAFGGRVGSADVLNATFKKPAVKLRRKSSQLGSVSEEGEKPATAEFDPSPLSWRVLEKTTQREITLIFSPEGIQLIYDGEEDNNVNIDWADAVSSEISSEDQDQTFTIVIRKTSKRACLDTYARMSYYTPKVGH